MPKLRIHDIDIYYEVTGQGTPLVLIHGLGSSTRDWERQVPVFSERYQVITSTSAATGNRTSFLALTASPSSQVIQWS